jgi:hypothetical protein
MICIIYIDVEYWDSFVNLNVDVVKGNIWEEGPELFFLSSDQIPPFPSAETVLMAPLFLFLSLSTL